MRGYLVLTALTFPSTGMFVCILSQEQTFYQPRYWKILAKNSPPFSLLGTKKARLLHPAYLDSIFKLSKGAGGFTPSL